MARLNDKVVLITGGASGLGKSGATLMNAEGAKVIISDINEDLGKATSAEIGDDVLFVHHDVSSLADWDRVIDLVIERFGRLDVLVNNAGIVVVADVENTTLSDWRAVHGVGTDGTFFGIQKGIGVMRESGGGSIINMSSLAGLIGYPLIFAYSASKGAIRSMTKSAAVYCAQNSLGIRVNSIHPGTIATPMVAGFEADVEEQGEERVKLLLGEPDDVGHMMVYLASDESKFVSGSEFVIDSTASITEGIVPG
ncbi:MAG: SDR family oxidoreductase [Cellvibrionales bacterium TMED148]|nr:short-chain dehydrogenase [Porticoccaceae bacterium]RPG93958.1 MAG: SDR family oxidoreductase [Cellvibrionales bacterium TMED148]